jgi:hypothetical protein
MIESPSCTTVVSTTGDRAPYRDRALFPDPFQFRAAFAYWRQHNGKTCGSQQLQKRISLSLLPIIPSSAVPTTHIHRSKWPMAPVTVSQYRIRMTVMVAVRYHAEDYWSYKVRSGTHLISSRGDPTRTSQPLQWPEPLLRCLLFDHVNYQISQHRECRLLYNPRLGTKLRTCTLVDS